MTRTFARNEELTALLIATGEELAPALAHHLGAQGVAVESCDPEDAAQLAFVAAPDVVVLAGAAARDGGRAVATALARRPATARLPIVLIARADDAGWSDERSQIAAVIERTASAHGMARRVARIVHASLGRTRATPAQSPRHRSAVPPPRGDHAGDDSSGGVDGSGRRTTPLALNLDMRDWSDRDRALLRGRRVLLVARTAASSDPLAQELRAAGALVAVCDRAGEGIDRARQLAPEVVVVDNGGDTGWAAGAVRRIRDDLVLRWASLLVIDWEQLCKDEVPDVATLSVSIDVFLTPDRELAQASSSSDMGRIQMTNMMNNQWKIEPRLEELGPIRLLRALAGAPFALRVTLRHSDGVVEVDVAEGRVAGACARRENDRGEPSGRGTDALVTMLGVAKAHVAVERIRAPRHTNIGAPIETAIAEALRRLPRPPAPTTHAGVTERHGSPAARVLRRAPDSELPSILDSDDAETNRLAPDVVERLRLRARRGVERDYP